MNLKILPSAQIDLLEGYDFYEEQDFGVGEYFLESIERDFARVVRHAGVHRKTGRFHTARAWRFPYSIYYTLISEDLIVWAVVDDRRDPRWLAKKLSNL